MTSRVKPTILARGSFGKVVLGKFKGNNIAVKVVRLKSNFNNITTEVEVLKKLSHPNIVSYIGHSFDKCKGVMYIAIEFCQRGDLSLLIQRHRKLGYNIPSQLVMSIFSQTIQALCACHYPNTDDGMYIIHGDIKLANILLDRNYNAKLCDFGLSGFIQDCTNEETGQMSSISINRKRGSMFSTHNDMWCLGLVLFELCNLCIPFVNYDTVIPTFVIRHSIKRTDIPQNFKSIIESLLLRDPKQRPSALDILKNEHFQEIKDIGEKYRLKLITDIHEIETQPEINTTGYNSLDWEWFSDPFRSIEDLHFISSKLPHSKHHRICMCSQMLNSFWLN